MTLNQNQEKTHHAKDKKHTTDNNTNTLALVVIKLNPRNH